MQFVKGPIFANVILADEINRTPPKTQAALLEAMQEHQVTAAGVRYPLEEPFFVLATQNPIEMEGTYPLPEAQLDRFMFNVIVDYLPEDEEVAVVQQTTSRKTEAIEPLFDGRDVLQFHEVVRKVPIAEDLVRHAVRLAAVEPPRARCAGFHQPVGELGSRSSGRSIAGAGGQGPGTAPRVFPRRARGHQGSGAPDAAASHFAGLSGRGRRRIRRLGDRPSCWNT